MDQPIETIVKIQDISKDFKIGKQIVNVLSNVTFNINKKDFIILIGKSGSGKSTLFHIILGLEHPTSGNINFLGENIYDYKSEDYLADFRKRHVGIVYQQPNWIRSLTVLENVAFPLLLLGKSKLTTITEAKTMLDQVQMIDWANYVPTELSSGQQQRVALARALITNPDIIMADEPTGNLDSESGFLVMNILDKLNKDGKTILMVTHDLEYLKFANVAIKITNGKTEELYRGNSKTGWIDYMKSKPVYEI